MYDPLVVMVILGSVAPFDHRFPLEAEEVKTTDPPEQKLKGPEEEMDGITGVFTVTN